MTHAPNLTNQVSHMFSRLTRLHSQASKRVIPAFLYLRNSAPSTYLAKWRIFGLPRWSLVALDLGLVIPTHLPLQPHL
jgi:hypothetical protein